MNTVQVYFPADTFNLGYHQIADSAPTCTSNNGMSSALSCQYDSSTRILTVTNPVDTAADVGTSLSFTISNTYKNHYSDVPVPGFFIQTLSSDGSILDKSSDISIQTITFATFVSASVSRADTVTTVSEYSAIRLTFQVGLPLEADCKIQITVPDDMLQTDGITQVQIGDSSPQTPVLDLNQNLVTISGCPSAISDTTLATTIVIKNLKNLDYVKNTNSFQVKVYAIQSGQMYNIAQSSGDLSLKATDFTPGSIASFSVDAVQNTKVSTSTQFKYTILPTTKISTSSKITISVPTTIVILDGSCQLISGSGAIQTDAACSISQNLIVVTNPFGQSGSFWSAGGPEFSFVVSTNAENPSSVKDVGSFQVSTYYSLLGSDYLIDQSTFSNVYTATSSTLQGQVSQSSFQASYSPTSYTWNFAALTFPQDGSLFILFPPTITMASGATLTCTAKISGVAATITSTLVNADSPLKIQISNPSAAISNLLQITCSGFQNPLSLGSTSSFQVFTQDSDGYMINMLDNGMVLTITTGPNVCGSGWYLSSTSVCTACPAGYQCGNGFLNECSGSGSEQFSFKGAASCLVCPAGYECPNKYSNPIICNKGFYSLLGDTICQICPAGSSCSSPVFTPQPCSAGYYSSIGSTYCSICPLGFKCSSPDQPPLPCRQGQYAPQGSTVCLDCPIGSFCPSTKIPGPQSCPAGYFTPSINQIQCLGCPAGFKCPAPSDSAIPCDEGTFSFGFAADCKTCPSGYYCPFKNKEPIICPKGKYSIAGQSECQDCPDGYSCLVMNSQVQSTCQNGQYRVTDGKNTICRDCPVGHACSDGASPPLACPAGTYSIGLQNTCTVCPIGYYCPTLGAIPMLCPLGSYQNETGKTFCYSCPPGSYCPSTDIVQPTQCLPGTYAPIGNLTACFLCPEGFMCPQGIIRFPIACQNGSYSDVGAASCIKCEGGYQCPDGRASKKVICTSGKISSEGSTHCINCPIGKKCTQMTSQTGVFKIGESLVQECLFGEISDEGQLTCTQCPAGFACNTKDSAGNSACSPGMYSLAGESTCKPCPAGFMCPDPTGLAITECADGSFSIPGYIKCLTCPPGFFCPFKNQAVMERCPPGTYSLGALRYCLECPEHYECPHRDQLIKLKDGYFSPAGTSVPLKCRAGWECKHVGVANSYVRPCEMGYYSPTGSSACIICPIGYYCPIQDHKPIECPEGMINPLPGQVKCTLQCPRGQFRVRNNTLTCETMNDGESYIQPWVNPVKCPAGKFSNSLNVESENFMGCQKCDPGVLCFSGETSSSSSGVQSSCPAGYWCNQVDERSSIFGMWACPAGFYASNAVAAKTRGEACIVCEAGFFCEGANRNKAQCEPGYYCPTQTERVTQFPCPAGTYQPLYSAQSSASCTTCTIGSYCPEGSANPILCLPGNICPFTGMKDYQQIPCPGGSYQTSKGQTSCVICPVGQYCPYGSVFPMLCPPGTYNDVTGKEFQTDCKLCPTNYLCEVFGLVSYQNQNQPPLEYGHLSPLGSKYAQELTCPPGTRSGSYFFKAEQCEACPAGTACSAGTSTTGIPIMAVRCTPGYYCPSGTMHDKQYPCSGGTYSNSDKIISQSQCNACPAGYFCPPGTYRPFICPNGYYCPINTENYQHYPCQFGTYIQTRGLKSADQCMICPKGFFCQENQVVFPKPCPVGSYSDVVGAKQPDNSLLIDPSCKPCLAGSKCPQVGTVYPQGCPPGTYSPDGSDQCFPCLEGFDCSLVSSAVAPSIILEDSDNGNLFTKVVTGTDSYTKSAFFDANSINDITDRVTLISGNATFWDTDVDNTAGSYESISIPGQYSLFYTKNSLSGLTLSYSSQPVPLSMLQYKSTAVSACPSGYFCLGSIKRACTPGYFCPKASMREIPCPVGTYSTQPGMGDLTQCLATPPGFFTNNVGSTSYSKNLCYLGYSCAASSHHQFMYRCPRGKYQNQFGQISCLDCPVGYYCTETSIYPIICPQGFYCPANTGYPIKCPAGTFGGSLGLMTSLECQKCTSGAYCSQPGISSPDGLCDPGFYCITGATVPNPTDVTTGNICTTGGFCEYGSKKVTSCPPGTYNPNNKGKNRQDCIACTPGKYCSGSSGGTPTGDCLAGYYCPLKSTVKDQVPADPGYYTPTGSSTQTLCAVGTYNPFTAQSQCTACRAGFFCDAEGMSDKISDCPQGQYCVQGSTEGVPCPEGTYNNEWNAKSISQCKPCQAGKYCSVKGLVEPEGDCYMGYYCKQSSLTPNPGSDDATGNFGPCPEGFYCPAATWNPIPCPAGTYSNSKLLQSVTQCTPCTEGYYCPSAGQKAPLSQCEAGFFCSQGSISARPALKNCVAGQYCPIGSASAINCPAGNYQPMPYQSTCIQCPAGYYCREATVTYKPTPCPAGYYCPIGTISANQYPCLAGTYQPYTGQTVCIDCDPGKFCQTQGLSTPTGTCSGGYYCIGKSNTATPTLTSIGGICAKGQFCPAGSAYPRDCSSGNYCGAIMLSAVSGQCQAGYYCVSKATKITPADLSLDGGQQCQPGYYCPQGTSYQIPCPAGTYSGSQGNTGLANCIACTAGYYCESSGLSQPTALCNQNYYCPLGSKSPKAIICPKGSMCSAGSAAPKNCYTLSPRQYQDQIGQSTCKQCPAGFQCTATSIQLCGENFYCPIGNMDKIPCPSGKYTKLYNASSQFECQNCPVGKYCVSDATIGTVITQCPSGVVCSGGASSESGSKTCPQGYYCPAGTQKEIPCKPGMYCSQTGLSAPEQFCSGGYYCNAGSKTATPTDGIQGNICPAGFYCPPNTASPIGCPIGTYNPDFGKISISQCQPCPTGKTCNKRGLSTFQGRCSAGFYCPDPQNPDVQQACPEGSFCVEGVSIFTKCPSQYYQPQKYQSVCLECPAGFYCSQSNTAISVICPIGKYCPQRTEVPINCPSGTYSKALGLKDVSECTQCREGYYCAGDGLSEPTGLCQAGYYCKQGSKTPTPQYDVFQGPCMPGYYCPEGSPIQLKCPVGTYSDQSMLKSISECTSCPSTFYCATKAKQSDYNSNTCSSGFLCGPGSKSSTPSLSETGTLCSAGSYCLNGISYQCSVGTYQPRLGASECISCPAGRICDQIGMTTPKLCPAGRYCPQTDKVQNPTLSYPCPAGTYSPFQGNQVVDDCIQCKQGYYCNEGSSLPTGLCLSPYYCAVGSSNPQPNTNQVYIMGSNMVGGLCPAGYKCVDGTIAPEPCPIGTYQPKAGMSTCDFCPAGKYCDELAIDSEVLKLKDCKAGYICYSKSTVPSPNNGVTGIKCTKGNYCPSGATDMIECPGGTYEPREGSSQCQSCPSGYFCPTGSTKPIECPIGFYCEGDSASPDQCPPGKFGHVTRLQSSDQCATCPAGKYCTNGVISGDCQAGFYCDSGAYSSTQDSKLCPIGHYCAAGTLYPTICSTGTTTFQRGAKQSSDCQDCKEGFYCLEGSISQFVCPKGYYCALKQYPIACPLKTYNPERIKSSVKDCLTCPPGYFCNMTGISNYMSFACPQGYYCPSPNIVAPIKCPAGTYNPSRAIINSTGCLNCPEGHYCPTGSIYPTPCKNGTYCPAKSLEPKTCASSFYCPSIIASQLNCPSSFYCPKGGSDQYIKCKNGTYCPMKSSSETLCPSGSFGSSDPRNLDIDTSCNTCDPGQYSIAGMNRCEKCLQGYICLGNTTTQKPLVQSKDNGYICPQGYYCPEGSITPKACPKGSYGPSAGLYQQSQCIQCPQGSYGDDIGITKCKVCGGSSRAQSGSESCFCSGLNRIYLKDTKACICKPGYVSSDSVSSNIDSIVDCQEKIYARCTVGQEQDLYGNCKAKDACNKECDGGSGKIQTGLGICQCDNAQSVEDICNDACRAQSKKVSFTPDGKVQVYDPITKTTQTVSQLSSGTMGELKCSQADQSQCQLLSVGKDQSTGDFTAQYSLSSSLTGKNRRLLESERRYLQVTSGSGANSIKNPVICMPQGSALLFDNLSSKNYPVYQKDSLINTNPTFDFSKFLMLEGALKNQTNGTKSPINRFVFTFEKSGVYVFSDANNTAKLTIVSVMNPSQQCPQNQLYASLTQANLLKVGIALQKDIVYSPDWGFFIGAVCAFLALILLSIFVIGYVYRKSWKTTQASQGQMMQYQHRQYEQVGNKDLEDPDALISINADSQAFYVLNQGSEVLRTKEQLKEKRAKDQQDRELRKKDRADKKRVLELEQVEDLKEKLNQHMVEIRRLFNMGTAEEDNGSGDTLLDDDEASKGLTNQKLLDQILKLKQIIKSNRRALEGDDSDGDEHNAEREKEEHERKERERRDNERKTKEEQERNAKDEAYAKQQEQQAKKAQEGLEVKKDHVLDELDKDTDKRKRDLLQKMQRNGGVQLSREDQEKFMSELDDNLNKIGEVLQRDEQDQEEALRRKLAERGNRRKKLQDKLKEQEKIVEAKQVILNEKKIEVEQLAQDQLHKLEEDLAKEKKDQEQAIIDQTEHLKIEKLASFEDKLREAKDTKDFGKVLEGYQQASKRVDGELEKEAAKQRAELEKTLKNRRGQKRAQIDKEKNEQIRQLQRQFEEQTEKERRQVEEIKGIIRNEDNASTGNQVILDNLEKLKQITSQGSQAEADIDKTLKQSKIDLMKKLSSGILNTLERKMHSHSIEQKDMDDKMKKEGKVLDELVNQSKAEAKTKLSQAMIDKEHLVRQIREVGDDDELRARLMGELDLCEGRITKLMESETADQDSQLQKRLAERRKKKSELAEQQRQMKQRQMQEIAVETLVQKDAVQIDFKRNRDREGMEEIIEDMKRTVPRDELPYAILKVIETKQEAELNDLLAKLFEHKCKELQEEVFHLIEEKMHMQNAILKDSKDSLELVLEIQSKATTDSEGDKKLREQAAKLKEVAKQKEERALNDLENQFKIKEQRLDREVSERMYNIESQKLQWLKEEQLKEKREILDKHLPMESVIRDINNEIAEEEERELAEYKREQEIEKARKLEEIERQRIALLQEMQDQKEKLEKAASDNKRLEQEEKKREQVQLARKKRQETAKQASDQISKLKKDLEKVNELLDTALSQEKARQLKLMQDALVLRVAEAERFEKEELERICLEEEEERKLKEEEERRLKEEQERLQVVKSQLSAGLQMVDKKNYMGGKIEKRSEYYNLLMRKKETKIMNKLQQHKFNAVDNFAVLGGGLMEIEGASGAATKEQQLKLLTDLLSKIEKLESGVRIQVTKQRQVLGLGNSQIGHYNNLETSSAHKSTNSFMTGSRYGGGSTFMK